MEIDISMHFLFAAALILPPAAHEHNERAMDHDEAGRLAEAEAELVSAYAAMPDARADLDGREQIMASLRSVLRRAHQASGEAGPLCRLREHLQKHVAGLETVFLDRPGPITLTGNQERIAEVSQQLAAFPADACEPVPPRPVPVVAPAAPVGVVEGPEPAGPAPLAPLLTAEPPARRLRIAGGVGFALTGAALGVMTYGLVRERRAVTAGRDLDMAIGGRPATAAELAELQGHLADARTGRQLALAGGISSAIFFTAAASLFVVEARIKAKASKTNATPNAVQMAPWRVPAGAGLLFRIALP